METLIWRAIPGSFHFIKMSKSLVVPKRKEHKPERIQPLSHCFHAVYFFQFSNSHSDVCDEFTDLTVHLHDVIQPVVMCHRNKIWPNCGTLWFIKSTVKKMKQKVSGARVHISKEAAGSSHEDVPGGSCPSQNRQNPLQAAANRLAQPTGRRRIGRKSCRRLNLYGRQHRESLNAGAAMRELARTGRQSALDLRAAAGKLPACLTEKTLNRNRTGGTVRPMIQEGGLINCQ